MEYTFSGLISSGGRYSSGIMLIAPSVLDRGPDERGRAQMRDLFRAASLRSALPRLFLLGLFLSLRHGNRLRLPMFLDQFPYGVVDREQSSGRIGSRIGVRRVPVSGIFEPIRPEDCSRST